MTTRLLSSATGDQCLLDKSALSKMNNTINCRVSFRTILKPLFGSLDIIFTCKQSALQISDTDSRELSYLIKNLTVRGVTVECRDTNTPLMASRQLCPFKLTAGWHDPERDGTDWSSWTDGHGPISVWASNKIDVILSGEINSASRPNGVDVIVKKEKLDTVNIDWKEWAFHPLSALHLPLKTGREHTGTRKQKTRRHPTTRQTPTGHRRQESYPPYRG